MSEQYFYYDGNGQRGPVDLNELVTKINLDTDIWCPNLSDWTAAKNVPEVVAAYNRYQEQLKSQNSFNISNGQNPNYYRQNNYQQNNRPYPDPNEPNFTLYIILSAICIAAVCLPFGIVALIKTLNAQKAYNRGDVNGCNIDLKSAKHWLIASLVGVVVLVVLYMVFIMVFIKMQVR
ncbi:MAG: CD225/dispanin family protein [Bacteroidales bacterium]|nr:CD225/dispanin family protein [Bacteroidales bacterium]